VGNGCLLRSGIHRSYAGVHGAFAHQESGTAYGPAGVDEAQGSVASRLWSQQHGMCTTKPGAKPSISSGAKCASGAELSVEFNPYNDRNSVAVNGLMPSATTLKTSSLSHFPLFFDRLRFPRGQKPHNHAPDQGEAASVRKILCEGLRAVGEKLQPFDHEHEHRDRHDRKQK
jgi:hypothetical protein